MESYFKKTVRAPDWAEGPAEPGQARATAASPREGVLAAAEAESDRDSSPRRLAPSPKQPPSLNTPPPDPLYHHPSRQHRRPRRPSPLPPPSPPAAAARLAEASPEVTPPFSF